MLFECAVIGSVLLLVMIKLYTPLRPSFEEKWKLQLVLMACELFSNIGELLCKLGVCKTWTVTGSLNSLLFKMAAEPVNDALVQTTDSIFDGVAVRIYKPKLRKPGLLPGLAFYHGGGLIVFNIDTYDRIVKQICVEAGVVIMSVEYRRTPEHQYPIPLEDCVTATKYFLSHAEEFGVESRNIGVAGDSAGGLLAASVSRAMIGDRSGNFPAIKFQGLIYPLVNAFDYRTPARLENDDATPGILATSMIVSAWVKYWNGEKITDYEPFLQNQHLTPEMKKSKYAKFADFRQLERYQTGKYTNKLDSTESTCPELAKEYEKILTDPLYCPLLADDMRGLPPAFVLTVEFDVLRDDGLLYSKRLQDANVQVRHIHIPNGFHGIFSFTRFKMGKYAVKQFTSYIKEVCQN